MATLVSTGQITIVDNNDAKPITAYITASQGTQQVFSEEGADSYIPDWTVSANVLTAKVYIGGAVAATEIAAQLTNKKWSINQGASLGTGVELSLAVNITALAPMVNYFFEGDYTDPVTGLVSHIIAQIPLMMLKTGTNAVFVLTKGNVAIQSADGITKNVAVICASLVRAAGVVTGGITYKFFENNGSTQVNNTMTTEYGLKTTAANVSPVGSAIDIGIDLPASDTWSVHNTIVISEIAVVEWGVYRIEVKDAEGVVYQTYFTVYDISDPYDTKLMSTAGDKLQNGIGNTDIYPIVKHGEIFVTADGWRFDWYFFDGVSPGGRAGFIDTARTGVATGRVISANTVGPNAVFGYSGPNITFVAGDMVKIVTPAGAPYYFEVASGADNTNLTVRTATVSTFLNVPWPAVGITASQFVGGTLFVCTGNGVTAGMRTTTGVPGPAVKIAVTGYEIDGKGSIICEAFKP